MLENFANFAKSSLAAGIISTDTSLSVTTGEGARFPFAPFRATIWNATDYVDPADDPDREIVLVAVVSGDSFTTVTRGQEGTTAVDHNTSGKTYALVAGLTAESITGLLPTVLHVTTQVDSNTSTPTAVAELEMSLKADRTYAIHGLLFATAAEGSGGFFADLVPIALTYSYSVLTTLLFGLASLSAEGAATLRYAHRDSLDNDPSLSYTTHDEDTHLQFDLIVSTTSDGTIRLRFCSSSGGATASLLVGSHITVTPIG